MEELGALEGRFRRERLEVAAGLVLEDVGGPARARRGVRREVLEVDATEDSEVVVSYQADVGPLGDELAAAVRLRPVPDEVAQAPHLVGRFGLDGAEHGLERMEIPVNVGDDGHSHSRRTLAKRAGLFVLAAVWVVFGFFLWRTSVPRLDIPSLDPRAYFSAAELAREHDYRRVSRALLLGSLAAQLLVLAVLVWKARPLADSLEGIGRGRIRTGVIVAVVVGIALWLATLPFGAVSLWWRRRYGLSTQSAIAWLRDQAVSVGVECLLQRNQEANHQQGVIGESRNRVAQSGIEMGA